LLRKKNKIGIFDWNLDILNYNVCDLTDKCLEITMVYYIPVYSSPSHTWVLILLRLPFWSGDPDVGPVLANGPGLLTCGRFIRVLRGSRRGRSADTSAAVRERQAPAPRVRSPRLRPRQGRAYKVAFLLEPRPPRDEGMPREPSSPSSCAWFV
jgi:hypothetical protein